MKSIVRDLNVRKLPSPGVDRASDLTTHSIRCFKFGGRATCAMDATAKQSEVEAAILEPVRAALLTDEAIERFCSLIREWVLT